MADTPPIRFAGSEEIARALDATQSAFARTRTASSSQRSDLLRRVAAEIGRRADDFVGLIVAEAGKPVSLARAEVQRARTTFALAADEAALGPHEERVAMDATPTGAGHTGVARRVPLGVILGVTPFNFPLNLVAHKVAPCIATGNAMIVKPSPRTPRCTLLLGEVLAHCGAPSGQIVILPFDHARVAGLLRDPRVKMLSFTGSAEAGWQLKREAVRQKVTLELGGNAACIVEADADWKKHAPKIVAGAFAYAGQSCISVQRVLVQSAIYAAFREEFLRLTRENAIAGDPRDEATVVGPMIDADAVARTLARIREAEACGARLLTPLRAEGRLLHPVVMENVPRSAAIYRDEAFAPVAILEPYESFADALAAANDSRFGLQAGVFTSDASKARAAFDALDVGAVLVNQVPTFRTENMPYGGVKESGCGREGVRYAMDEMTDWKLLVTNERED